MRAGSFVAATPTDSSPQRTPASTQFFAGSYTRTPTSSSPGWRITSRNARKPMLPVAHWTTRIRSLIDALCSTGRLRERLALEELVEAGFAHLPADARLLVAAEGRVGRVVNATVDAHRPRPDPTGDREPTFAITAQHRAREPEDRVVRDPDRVVVTVVRQHHEHRAEELVLRARGVLVGTDEQRRLVEVPARKMLGRPATHNRLRAVGNRTVDVAGDLLPLAGVDERPHVRRGIGRVAVRDAGKRRAH